MATQYVTAAGIGAGSGRLSGRDPSACSRYVKFLQIQFQQILIWRKTLIRLLRSPQLGTLLLRGKIMATPNLVNNPDSQFSFQSFLLNCVIAIVMLKFKNTYISSLFGIKSNVEFQKILRNISTFRFQLPDFLSYHLRNARNGSLRTTYIISPPPPLPKKLAPSASFGPSHRWIASLHNKKPGYEPGDCMLLVMAFGRSILCLGSCKVS